MTATPFNPAMDNTYARDLDGFYVAWQGAEVPAPKVLRLNTDLATSLGLDGKYLASEDGAAFLVGMNAPEGSTPLAMAYAGHQFGGFSPQLGDGRALLVGELTDRQGKRHDLHLKGSGATPFSRGGDGKAALGPVLREYLIGEAMHALGVPTTRALAAVTTGEHVYREVPLPGAVLARVASSHLRVGTFQFFAARQDIPKLQQLADYAINRHYPELSNVADKYLRFFEAVRDAQASLIAKWMNVGFIHGVMNTDNMTISGETIDYGPCAFMDRYDAATVFSSIDHQGRYAFGRQPSIAVWNLARLAECLVPLVEPEDANKAVDILGEALSGFSKRYEEEWPNGLRQKIGLQSSDSDDLALANGLFEALQRQECDFTFFFRSLADVLRTNDRSDLTASLAEPDRMAQWLDTYQARLSKEGRAPNEVAAGMDKVNPLYIPRNHLVEEALAAAYQDDMAPFDKLLEVLSHPFEKQDGLERYEQPASLEAEPYVTYCGT